MDLLKRVSEVISEERLIEEGERVLVAVSGGPDSVCLFHLLFQLKDQKRFHLSIAHINHGLRGEESERDEYFVRNLGEKYGIPVHVERVDVKGYAMENGVSVQQAARTLRYRHLFSIADSFNYQKIAVGHNLDDQVETFLLRLIKGTGMRGLRSIPLRREKIIRPLLFFPRSEIEKYLREKNLEYVEDSSNRKLIYERNYLRAKVLPLLSRINPRFKEKIIAFLQDLTYVNRLFDERAKEFLESKKRIDGDSIILPREDLKALDSETRFRVLANIVSNFDGEIILQRRHAQLIDRILFSKKPSSSIRLPLGIIAETAYGDFYLKRVSEFKIFSSSFPLREGENLLEPFSLKMILTRFPKDDNFSPYTSDPLVANLDANLAVFLEVRTFREGDRFMPLGMREEIKVKDFFIKRKVPKGERRKVPIVTSKGKIVWIVGFRIDERFKVTEKTDSVLRIVCRPLGEKE